VETLLEFFLMKFNNGTSTSLKTDLFELEHNIAWLYFKFALSHVLF